MSMNTYCDELKKQIVEKDNEIQSLKIAVKKKSTELNGLFDAYFFLYFFSLFVYAEMAKEIKSRKASSKENLLSSQSSEEVEAARSLARELGEKLSYVKANLYRKEKEIEELHEKMEKGKN